MEIKRAKMFSLLGFTYLCVNLCVSVNPHRPGAFFTVGSGFDEDSHFLELSSTWLFNPRWSSGEAADVESRPPEDSVIRMFGQGDEHIDLQLPSQRPKAEEASPSVTVPILGSFTPLPPPCLSLPCPFPSSLSVSPLPASLSPELSHWFTPSSFPSFPPPMPPPLPISSSPPPFNPVPNPSAPFPPPLPAPVPGLPFPSSPPPQSSSPVSPSPTHPISPPSISPSPSSSSPSAPSISTAPTSPSSSSVPSPFVSPPQFLPPSPSPSSSTLPSPTPYPIFTPSPSPSPSESTSPSPFPIFTPAPTSLSPSISPSSSPSSIYPPSPIHSPTPSPIVSPTPSPSPSSSVSPSPTLYPIFPPSPFPSPMESPSPAPSPIFPPAPTSLSPVSSPTPSPQSLPQSSPTPSPSPIPSPAPIPPQITMLENLTILNGAKLVPQFNPYTFNYTASLGSKVRRFHVIAYLPEGNEDYSLYIDSIPLETGKKSPPLRLGKKGETVTFDIFVRAINHYPSTYTLSVTREASHKGLGTVATVFVVIAYIVGAVILLVLGYATYVYVRKGRMPRLSDFQQPKERASLYTPLITSRSF